MPHPQPEPDVAPGESPQSEADVAPGQPPQPEADVAPGQSLQTGPDSAAAQAPGVNLGRERMAELLPVGLLKAGTSALVILAVIAVLAICYMAKLVLVTLFTSLLLAFMLEPLVERMERIYLPRPLGALIVVTLLLASMYGAVYYSYSSAVSLATDLPKYTGKLRESLLKVRQQAQQIQRQTASVTESVLPDDGGEKAVRVEQSSSWSDTVTRVAGSVTEFVFIVSFIPFLVYFMLSWQGHMRSATVMLFKMEDRNTAYVTLGQISAMMRSFIVGNLVVGLFISLLSLPFFFYLGVPYFYFMAFISGFLSLIPYLGVVVAAIPPLVASLGVLNGTEMLAICIFVLLLHVFAINVLFPKILGKRLQLNPLVLTVALLLWGWLWGAMGLILAVPITAAMKIIFDHIESLRPLGAWMGE